jgi:hypothetical protein
MTKDSTQTGNARAIGLSSAVPGAAPAIGSRWKLVAALASVLIACRAPTSGPAPSEDAAASPPRTIESAPGPTVDASVNAVDASVNAVDASVDASDDGSTRTDAEPPLPAPLREMLGACLRNELPPALGKNAVFYIHVVIEVDEGGKARVSTWGHNQPQRTAPAGSCLDGFGQRFAAEFPGRRRHSFLAKGPTGGWTFVREPEPAK